MSNMVIQTNMLSLNAHRNMGITGTAQARASARLSSGFRINTAADDAAGLGISEKMRGQIRGLDQASRNAQDGISLIQTAEGAMQTVSDLIIRIRELVIQAANDTNVHEDGNEAQSDRARIQDEINQLLDEIDQISYRTEFNTRTLLNGDWASGSVRISAGMSAAIQAFLSTNATEVEELRISRENLDIQNEALSAMRDQLAFLQDMQQDILDRTSTTAMNNFLAGIPAAWSAEVARLGVAEADIDPATARAFVANHTNAHFGTSLTADELGIDAADVMNVGQPFGDLTVLRDALRDDMAARLWSVPTGRDRAEFQTDVVPASNSAIDSLTPAVQITNFADIQTRINSLSGTAAGAGIQNQQEAIGASHAAIRQLLIDLEQQMGGDETIRVQFFDFDSMLAAFEGTPGRALWFHVGANENQGVRLYIENVSVHALDLSHLRTVTAGNMLLGGSVVPGPTGFSGVMVESGEELGSVETGFMTSLDEAMMIVNSQRSILGAIQNRLEFTIQNLDIASENLQASNSRIRDADMAREMMRFTQTNVLQQAAISMLAQANMQPQNILQLLS